MTKIVKKAPFGFSLRIENFYRKFRGFDNGIPVFEMILGPESKIAHVSLVKNPAHGSYANFIEEINDGKDDVIFRDDYAIPTDLTDLFIKHQKYSLIEQWIFRWRNRKPKFVEYDEYESVLNINGFTIHVFSNEHPEKGEIPHFHVKHKGENINYRISLSGKFLSIVKGYNGETKRSKKTVEEHYIPFLDKKNVKNTGMIGREYLIFLWNKNNPHLLIDT